MTESPYAGHGRQMWTGDRVANDPSGLSDVELQQEIARLRRACGEGDEGFRTTSRARTSSLATSYDSPNSRLASPMSSAFPVSDAALFGRSPRAPLLDSLRPSGSMPLLGTRLDGLATINDFDSGFEAIRRQEQHLADISARRKALEAYLKDD